MTMLEYSKVVLEKVHFEPKIFRKELRKFLRWINKEEGKKLLTWCRTKFKNTGN
jgi:hypothetical protein